MNWICVKERLPNKLQKVLFHWVCPGGNRNISMGYLCDEGWDIYLPYHSYKMHPERLKVTHWMNLPLFPKYEFERFTSSLIIDDPLAKLHEEVYKELMVHGECTIFIPNEDSDEEKATREA